MKKVPIRKCLATKKSYPKEELFRVVKTPNNEVLLDISGKANGRGAYIHKSIEAIDVAIKSHCLDRALEAKVNEEIYERMKLFLKLK